MRENKGNAAQTAETAGRRYALGLDIGTTSLCATAVDIRDGTVVRTLVRPNLAAIPGEATDERLQDPDRIVDELRAMLEEWRDLLPGTAAIGISAQMHGILYVDGRGRAVSPLYTWQDGRGDRPAANAETEAAENGAAPTGRKAAGGKPGAVATKSGQAASDAKGSGPDAKESGPGAKESGPGANESGSGPEESGPGAKESGPGVKRAQAAADSGGATYREQLEALSGYSVPSGYGLLTHDVLRRTGAVPAAAAKLCTVGDYAAMRLAGRALPLIDATQAAGLGLFDLRSRSFDAAAAARAGIDASLLPELAGAAGARAGAREGADPACKAPDRDFALAARDGAIAGRTADGIPVAVAIGDNQASYLGTVPALAGEPAS
ncbi:FGGY family carbohydrate kinase [Cohnella rhizosphaerae]|uniref:FGGY family carbohydrate kinase n=1 Tax=Cohnella rhizosphaerae TaxID=1457232 RepID=A0A9X4QSJ9_9BACL|nr:FGGY family carbohydrate kinase [Cohnella rhizosphaerae]MDG0810161.1 FGGY family carbohydrate kinase [Cohnella rhizosphaerae]